MIALRNSIRLPFLTSKMLGYARSHILKNIDSDIDPLTEVCDRINDAIVEEPPFSIKEGGLIRTGFSKELDELKDSIKDGKAWISGLEAAERERTGIRNLKVGYNRVFGYYLEVTRSFYDQIPDNYIRKQTLANAERFITPRTEGHGKPGPQCRSQDKSERIRNIHIPQRIYPGVHRQDTGDL